jgi:hypothetical protein
MYKEKIYININMNIKEISILLDKSKVSYLKTLCKRLSIKKYSKWKKNELSKNIKCFLSCRIIQRRYRKYKMCNDLCYITYNDVKYPCYPIKLNSGQYYYYNLPELVDYFLSSGVFKEPVTKRDLTIKELNSLDKYIKKVGIKKKNLCDAKKNTEYYRKQLVKDHTINLLQDQIRETVCILRERLESDDIEDPTVEVDLTNKIMYFPALKSYFRELNDVSKRGLKISFSTVFQILKDIQIIKSVSKILLKDDITCNLNTLYKKYFP